MTEVCMIMAIGPDNVIGKGDKLAWHSKMDFIHFVRKTKGWPCIFGATTFYGLPKYPLKNRLCVVVNIDSPGAQIKVNENGSWFETNSIDDAIKLVSSYDKIFICGGKSIYKYCLDNNMIDSIYLTQVSTRDGKLEEDIEEHPNDYVKFPIDLIAYTEGWYKLPIIYTGYNISENCICHFTKFMKEKPKD